MLHNPAGRSGPLVVPGIVMARMAALQLACQHAPGDVTGSHAAAGAR